MVVAVQCSLCFLLPDSPSATGSDFGWPAEENGGKLPIKSPNKEKKKGQSDSILRVAMPGWENDVTLRKAAGGPELLVWCVWFNRSESCAGPLGRERLVCSFKGGAWGLQLNVF